MKNLLYVFKRKGDYQAAMSRFVDSGGKGKRLKVQLKESVSCKGSNGECCVAEQVMLATLCLKSLKHISESSNEKL